MAKSFLPGSSDILSAPQRAARTLLLFLTFTLSCVPAAFSQNDIIPLTNSDILTMVRNKLPSNRIIARIKNSSCAFDTFPHVLAELRYMGVPDEVLRAMVKAPHGGRPTVVGSGSPSVKASPNNGSSVLRDRSETTYNARFFVAPMEDGFDGIITALMLEKRLPVRVVADDNRADFIVVGALNKTSSNGSNNDPRKWYEVRDRNQARQLERVNGSIWLIRMRDQTVIWVFSTGDRSLSSLDKGARRKVAERLVNKMKDNLFTGRSEYR